MNGSLCIKLILAACVGVAFCSSSAAANADPAVSCPDGSGPQSSELPTTVIPGATDATKGPTGSPVEGSPAAERLHLSFTPFVWLTSFSGTTGVAGLKLDINESFLDIIDESDSVFGLMGAIDIEYKRFVFQINGTYSHAEFSSQRQASARDLRGAEADASISSDLTVDAGWYEAIGGYRFAENAIHGSTLSRFTLDGFVGLRITDMDLTLNVTADKDVTLPSGITLEEGVERGIDQSEAWVEPIVGTQLGFRFGEHWSAVVRGDVGGFGVDGSDFSWQTLGVIGYRWQLEGWSIGAFGGYRALGQDYSKGGFTWDVVTHGPILGCTITLSF